MLYDAFICHASEDKEDFVRPLAHALQELHIEVWYDEFSLTVGDSLRQAIDRGLSQSRFGIVVFSRPFFQKQWPQRELNALFSREIDQRNTLILPIWHEIDASEVLQYSPLLADKIAIDSRHGIRHVCAELLRILKPQASPLVVARDELIAFGLSPPVVTDEWWLDVVEASNRVPDWGFVVPDNSTWGRWSFPLPNPESNGQARGVRLARTAMQLGWTKAAESMKITQLTCPQRGS